MWPIMMTPNRGTLSIIGLYNWDDHIFDLLQIPAGVDRDDVIENILMECGELETMYPDWDFMYRAINFWSRKELPTWEHIYEMTQAEYNPIENYDRMETELEGENVSEKRLRASERSRSSDTSSDTTNTESIHSGSKNDTVSQNNTTNQVAGFNTDNLATQSGSAGNTFSKDETSGSSLLQNEQNVSSSGSESDQENALEQGDTGRNKNRQLHAHGNIGTMTVASMMAGELETYPKINIVNYITEAFKQRFCVLVY